MWRDAPSLTTDGNLRADVCIVGAGAAGLSLAHALGAHGVRVLVVESGHLMPRRATQLLADGDVSGEPYYPLDECRVRALGGTTVTWGGWCRPLDAIDFEARAWVAESGWPFSGEHLRPYYERAQSICELGRLDYDPPPATGASWRHQSFHNTLFQIRPTRFGDVYGAAFRRSGTVDVVLNATLLSLHVDRGGRRIASASIAAPSGERLTVAAGDFVLATGGIENARLLLASQGEHGPAIGDEHGLVGRFFMDHLHVPLGLIRSHDGVPEFFGVRDRGDVRVRGVASITEQYQRATRSLGLAVTMHDAADPHDLLSIAQAKTSYRSLQSLVHALRRRHLPERVLHHLGNVGRDLPEVARLVHRRYVKPRAGAVLLGCRAEHAPNIESRVSLSTRVDRFGMPMARLDWRITDAEVGSIERAQAMLADAFGPDLIEMFPVRGARGGPWMAGISGGAHHMGTTRMHPDARHGVVDANCRVHGMSNLYVAGSSVFPTGGWAPPTLTIVALALRLADHLMGAPTSTDLVT